MYTVPANIDPAYLATESKMKIHIQPHASTLKSVEHTQNEMHSTHIW